MRKALRAEPLHGPASHAQARRSEAGACMNLFEGFGSSEGVVYNLQHLGDYGLGFRV